LCVFTLIFLGVFLSPFVCISTYTCFSFLLLLFFFPLIVEIVPKPVSTDLLLLVFPLVVAHVSSYCCFSFLLLLSSLLRSQMMKLSRAVSTRTISGLYPYIVHTLASHFASRKWKVLQSVQDRNETLFYRWDSFYIVYRSL
jgi:xanthine/uracil/vitamin C permease (AzgA family)